MIAKANLPTGSWYLVYKTRPDFISCLETLASVTTPDMMCVMCAFIGRYEFGAPKWLPVADIRVSDLLHDDQAANRIMDQVLLTTIHSHQNPSRRMDIEGLVRQLDDIGMPIIRPDTSAARFDVVDDGYNGTDDPFSEDQMS